VCISKERDGSATTYFLRAFQQTAQSTSEAPAWQAYEFGLREHRVRLALKGDPERLMNLDADGDGKRDFLIFQSSERPIVFLKTNADGVPTEVAGDGSSGLGNV